MMLQAPTAERVAKPAVAAVGKPISASCCHAAAVVGVAGGFVWLGLSIFAPKWLPVGESHYVGLSAIGSGVVWWALGDIVASLHRIAARS